MIIKKWDTVIKKGSTAIRKGDTYIRSLYIFESSLGSNNPELKRPAGLIKAIILLYFGLER